MSTVMGSSNPAGNLSSAGSNVTGVRAQVDLAGGAQGRVALDAGNAGAHNQPAFISRAAAEDFLYTEAALLDDWRLDDWLTLLTEDACYWVPPNDTPEAEPTTTLFTIADDIRRIRARVTRLKDKAAHAEYPHSRTRRLITNVRVFAAEPSPAGEPQARVEANFVVYRYRREERIREYVGCYRHTLRLCADGPRIARRIAVLDALELASLGSVSFIL